MPLFLFIDKHQIYRLHQTNLELCATLTLTAWVNGKDWKATNEFLYSIAIYDNNSTLNWQITSNDFSTRFYIIGNVKFLGAIVTY